MYTVYMYEPMASLATWGKTYILREILSRWGSQVGWGGCSADDGVVVWGGVGVVEQWRSFSLVHEANATLMMLRKNQNQKSVPGSTGGISYA